MANPIREVLNIGRSLVRGAGEAAGAKPFYSPIDQAIAAITQTKGTGEQMLAQLLKSKGVAKELKDRPAVKAALMQPKVTKEQLQKVAADNPAPQIFERVDKGPSSGRYEIEHNSNTDRYEVLDDSGNASKSFHDYEDAEDYVKKLSEGTTEFDRYQLGGGQNYREIKIMLPTKKIDDSPEFWRSEALRRTGRTPDQLSHSERQVILADVRADQAKAAFKSEHFPESNILAHARVSDRTAPTYTNEGIADIQRRLQEGLKIHDPNAMGSGASIWGVKNGVITPLEAAQISHARGWRNDTTGAVNKILHIEEIQSDWHQAARDIRKKEIGRLVKSGMSKEDAARQVPIDYGYKDIGDAPFKDNWHELVLKRMLDDAVKNGYNKVVISPGAVQVGRYEDEFRSVVDNLSIAHRPKDVLGERISVSAEKDGVDTFYHDYEKTKDGWLSIQPIKGQRRTLEETVGKDILKKFESDANYNKTVGQGHSLSRLHDFFGDDLTIGGEGMKGFYDDIIPSYLNNYGKQWGATVGKFEIDPTGSTENRNRLMNSLIREGHTPESAKQQAIKIYHEEPQPIQLHSYDITPQMSAGITEKGQPLNIIPAGIGAGMLAAQQEEVPEQPEMRRGGAVGMAGGGKMGVFKALGDLFVGGAKAKLPKGQQAVLSADKSAANLERFLAESGEKRRMYHGSKEPNIIGFKTRKDMTDDSMMTGHYADERDAVFVSPEPDFTKHFSQWGYTDTHKAPTTYPVYVQVKNSFDFDNPDHLKRVKETYLDMYHNPDSDLYDPHMLSSERSLDQHLFNRNVDDLPNNENNWIRIENEKFQDVLKDLGFDSFYTRERGTKNLGVYDPSNIKSAVGNRGTYDTSEPDLNKAKGGSVGMDAMRMALMNKKVQHKQVGGISRVRRMMAGAPNKTTNIIKEGGGNWLAGGVEKGLKGLKTQNRTVDIDGRNWAVRSPKEEMDAIKAIYPPDVLSRTSPEKRQQVEYLIKELERQVSVNQFIDKQLTGYIKNKMGTREDPIRLAADAFPEQKAKLLAAKQVQIDKATADMERARQLRGYTPEMMIESQKIIRKLEKEKELIDRRVGLHYEPQGGAVDSYKARQQAGFPVDPISTTPYGQAWEDISDAAIEGAPYRMRLPMVTQETAPDALRALGGEFAVQNPNAMAYSIKGDNRNDVFRGQESIRKLGLNHMMDELRNATNSASGLPKDLLIDPKDLSKWTMAQASEHVDKINAYRANQINNARLENMLKADVHKEYSEKGMRWVKLNKPGQFAEESDAMGHSVRGYEPTEGGGSSGYGLGGYSAIKSGEAEVYSLRDAKGQPHATVEVNAKKTLPHLDDVKPYFQAAEEEAKKLPRGYTSQDVSDIATKMAMEKMPSKINQIKGPGNAAPNEEYLPYIQDFVRSGNYSDVRDMQNTGLFSIDPASDIALYLKNAGKPVPKYATGEELNEISRVMANPNVLPPEGGMKDGGVAHLQGGGLDRPLTMNPNIAAQGKEIRFRKEIAATPWYLEFLKQYGEAPDLSRSADYDYRKAWEAGIRPERNPYDGNRYHWPSSTPSGEMLKSATHPTAWKEHYMQATGVDPDSVGVTQEDWIKSNLPTQSLPKIDDGMKDGGVAHLDKGGTPETLEQEFQRYLRMLRVNAIGGKDQYGVNIGGRLGVNIPLSQNVSIEPYVSGSAYKPENNNGIYNGTGGANLNIRFNNGGAVNMDAMRLAVMNKQIRK